MFFWHSNSYFGHVMYLCVSDHSTSVSCLQTCAMYLCVSVLCICVFLTTAPVCLVFRLVLCKALDYLPQGSDFAQQLRQADPLSKEIPWKYTATKALQIQKYKCTNTKIQLHKYKNTNVQIQKYKCTNTKIQMHKYKTTQKHQCKNKK